MSDFWLIFITGLLVYLLYDREREKRNEQKKNVLDDDSLLEFVGKYCEIDLKDCLIYIDGDYEISGVIKEMDSDWLVIETTTKDKTRTRIIRKSLINHIKIVNEK